jgi:hypothetical protein
MNRAFPVQLRESHATRLIQRGFGVVERGGTAASTRAFSAFPARTNLRRSAAYPAVKRQLAVDPPRHVVNNYRARMQLNPEFIKAFIDILIQIVKLPRRSRFSI